MDILGNLIAERLTISSRSTNGPKDEGVAAILYENVQSILNCTSYSFEDVDTLDHDFNIELTDDDSPFDNMKMMRKTLVMMRRTVMMMTMIIIIKLMMIVIGTSIHMMPITMMNVKTKA